LRHGWNVAGTQYCSTAFRAVVMHQAIRDEAVENPATGHICMVKGDTRYVLLQVQYVMLISSAYVLGLYALPQVVHNCHPAPRLGSALPAATASLGSQ
jgi:hypothetical protein